MRPGETFTGERRGFRDALTETDRRTDNDRKTVSLGNRNQCPPMDSGGGGGTGGDGTSDDGAVGDGGGSTVPGVNVSVE